MCRAVFRADDNITCPSMCGCSSSGLARLDGIGGWREIWELSARAHGNSTHIFIDESVIWPVSCWAHSLSHDCPCTHFRLDRRGSPGFFFFQVCFGSKSNPLPAGPDLPRQNRHWTMGPRPFRGPAIMVYYNCLFGRWKKKTTWDKSWGGPKIAYA